MLRSSSFAALATLTALLQVFSHPLLPLIVYFFCFSTLLEPHPLPSSFSLFFSHCIHIEILKYVINLRYNNLCGGNKKRKKTKEEEEAETSVSLDDGNLTSYQKLLFDKLDLIIKGLNSLQSEKTRNAVICEGNLVNFTKTFTDSVTLPLNDYSELSP